MKRFLLLLLIVSSFGAKAQLYNNEWIDYNKTYYKFKVGVSGLYRINQAALASIGLGNINADYFQIWRHGKEVPLYTSVQGAPLGPSDFIEFWGEANDGKVDKELYRQPDYQLSDKWSLQTDTAAFFLTVNPAGGNLRLINTENNVAGNTLAPEPYFIHTEGIYFRNKINPGRAELVGSSYTYSSSYDYGEGWTSSDITGNSNTTVSLLNLRPYTGSGAPAPSLYITASGNAVNARYFRVRVNGDSVLGPTMNYYDYVKTSASLSVSQISSGTANIEIANRCAVTTDRMVVGQIELKYARLFDFGEVNSFTFELPANPAGNYLEIKGVNFVAVPPILYDITNGRRYIAEYSNPALLKYALLPSATKRTLILMNQHPSMIHNITSFTLRNFINYKLAANQGDFLIITNASLVGPSGGIDPVEDYRAYRSSVQGGSFNAKVYLYDQLEDQFGFGIKKHPLSIRNFLRWARANYSHPLKNIFIIGKGVVYSQVRIGYESNPDLDKLDLVPTFGDPASDNLLSAEGSSSIPLTPIGRISVINRTEIADYLEKVKQYEQVQTVSSPLSSDMLWKKNVVHITGASDDVTSDILLAALNGHKKIIEDTLYGAKVFTFSKSSSSSVEQLASNQLASLINGGIGLLTYFGHSSATTLEFNLDNPQNYSNAGKYPVFIVMGCNAGNFYNFNTTRFSVKETISERYVLAKERGSVAFMASTHLGIVHYLDIYNTRSYQSASFRKYGASLGEIMYDAIVRTFALLSENDFYARFQCEQFTLHGDPAIRMYSFDKPDYVIEEPMVKVSSSFITVGSGSYKITANFANLGKAPDTKMVVSLEHVYPGGLTKITRDTVNSTKYMDSIVYTINLGAAIVEKGQHKFTIKVDADNNVDEQYETNNSVTKEVYVFEDEIRPVYPYNLSIVNQQDVKFVASTANAFAEMRTYTMEMDTTELFNSPFKITRTVNSVGGIVEFTPGITLKDSVAYYWRVTPTVPNTDPKWNTASFTFIGGSSDGFSQGHLYQHLKSDFNQIKLDSTSHKFIFDSAVHNFFMRNGVFPTANSQATGFSVSIDDHQTIINVCGISGIIFNVIDPVTLKPWINSTVVGPGRYGSDNVCGTNRLYNFQYNILDTNKRRKAVEFLDLIPDGYFVVVRNISGVDPASNTYASTWKNDESYLGPGNSIYHRLKEQGFADIDSFNRPRAFLFIYKKNRPAFTPKSVFSEGINDNITLSANFLAPDTSGTISSPLFGPAKGWKELHWRGKSIDTASADKAMVSVYGVTNSGNETLIYDNLGFAQQDFDISAIDPVQFPYIKLRMKATDTAYYTPYQLKHWMVTYDPVPEGAVAPSIYFTSKDTVEVGEPAHIGIAFKNISKVAFDSLRVKVVITDKNNVDNIVPIPRQKDLQPGDTVKIDIPIDTRSLSGRSTIFMNFNPDYDQPEQYLFNNYVFRNLYVRPDSLNPLLDVTFDGTHILNKDIVSPKPSILVKLKDEAKWMVLDDTSLLTVNVRYPDGALRRFYFDNNSDTMQFIPAGQAPNPNNEASINFRPYFSQDGEYELIITGKDRSENTAGNIQYRVAFQVYNKPMISNMLNYPNPFTTSTAFVFTITGSEIPQNIRIQILTITGKVVREITKDELGPLHIGRNITEFKWDGTDQYGQKLANGIYLYRVITNLNGKSLDKFKSSGDNTDKFFNNGYGKMYLMR